MQRDGWLELEKKIKAHEMSMMDAPYFGWTREFINGYELALQRVQKDITECKNVSRSELEVVLGYLEDGDNNEALATIRDMLKK